MIIKKPDNWNEVINDYESTEMNLADAASIARKYYPVLFSSEVKIQLIRNIKFRDWRDLVSKKNKVKRH